MSTEKINIEKLFDGLEKGVLNEETQTKVSALINETVEARVSAKEKLLLEEVEVIKAKLVEQTTALETEKAKILKEAEENEKVLVEEAEKYKKELEETVIQETVKYKETLDSKKAEEISKFKTDAETLLLEEAKLFKEKQEAVLVEEVKKFKAELLDKVNDYLEVKLTQEIPASIMESATKMAVLEPLVTSIMESFSSNFVKLDTTSYKLLSEAKSKISTLEANLEEKSKIEVKLKKEKKDVEKTLKINALTEGLTRLQKEKAVKLLENVELEQLEPHFNKIKDIIIESNIKPAATIKVVAPVTKLEESAKKGDVAKPVISQADQAILDHQLKAILTESDQKTIITGKTVAQQTLPDGANPQMGSWAKKVTPAYKNK